LVGGLPNPLRAPAKASGKEQVGVSISGDAIELSHSMRWKHSTSWHSGCTKCEFQHFKPRFNKTSLFCGPHSKRG